MLRERIEGGRDCAVMWLSLAGQGRRRVARSKRRGKDCLAHPMMQPHGSGNEGAARERGQRCRTNDAICWTAHVRWPARPTAGSGPWVHCTVNHPPCPDLGMLPPIKPCAQCHETWMPSPLVGLAHPPRQHRLRERRCTQTTDRQRRSRSPFRANPSHQATWDGADEIEALADERVADEVLHLGRLLG